MPLRFAGFFRELRHGDPGGPSLRDVIATTPQPEQELIAHYLDTGEVLATTGSLVDDQLEPATREVARLEVLTDGIWVWPRDLSYYVMTYNAIVPSDFTEHMRRRGWRPPNLTRDELLAVEAEYQC